MKRSSCFTALLLIFLFVSGQSIDLTFTAIDNASYVRLDSIKIINRTQGGDTVLYWPDTVLSILFVDQNENPFEENSFQIFQNYPNPVVEDTKVSFYIPRMDKVNVFVTDILGRVLIKDERILDRGKHIFLLTPGSENICLFTVKWNGQIRSIKVLMVDPHSNGTSSLEYIGKSNHHQLKTANSDLEFPFSPGDKLLYSCYYDTLESGIHDNPVESQSYSFQFATNIPCPEVPTIEYGGQVYNTIQICSQCWLKENLNVGEMIDAPNPQTNNDTIEKYCMANMSYLCNKWGGLYFWTEMMNYIAQSGGRGICPEGWHVPDELDWQILEGVADTKFGIGDPTWGIGEWRGLDAGGNLKQSGYANWEPPNTGATNAYGFTALPGGYFVQGDFWGHNYKGIFWTSEPSTKRIRNMDWNEARIRRSTGDSGLAVSVRCLKD